MVLLLQQMMESGSIWGPRLDHLLLCLLSMFFFFFTQLWIEIEMLTMKSVKVDCRLG